MVGNLELFPACAGYRHTIDPFLLCDFVTIKHGECVVDLGTATGIIPLVLVGSTGAKTITGVVVQPGLASQAEQNIVLNNFQDRINIIHSDIRDISSRRVLHHESFDVVVSNPPYRKKETGKVSPDAARAACRHEIHGDIRDFLETAFYLLRNNGRCYLIYLPERLPELLSIMRNLNIEPKRIRCVHSKVGSDAKMVLVEGRKNGNPGMKVDPPLTIYEGGVYSMEVRKIFQMDE